MSKLRQISHKEKLVIYHDMLKCWIVNIATFKFEDGRSRTEQYRTSISLFYLHNPQQEISIVGFSKKTNRHKTSARADKQIKEEPFLVSIKAYRYKKQ